MNTKSMFNRLLTVMAMGVILVVVAACGTNDTANNDGNTADAGGSSSAGGSGSQDGGTAGIDIAEGNIVLYQTPLAALPGEDGEISYSRVYIQKEVNKAVSSRTIPVRLSGEGSLDNVGLTVKVDDGNGNYAATDAVAASIVDGKIQFTFADGRYDYDADSFGGMYNKNNNFKEEYTLKTDQGINKPVGYLLMLEVKYGESVLNVPLSVLPTLKGDYDSHAQGKPFPSDTNYDYLKSWLNPSSIELRRYEHGAITTGGTIEKVNSRKVGTDVENVKVVDLRSAKLTASSSNLFQVYLGEDLYPNTGFEKPLPSNIDLVIENSNPDVFKVVAYKEGILDSLRAGLNIAVFPTKAGESATIKVSLAADLSKSVTLKVASVAPAISVELKSIPSQLNTGQKGETVTFTYATENLPEGAAVKLFESVDNDGTTYFFDGLGSGQEGIIGNDGVVTFEVTVKNQEGYLGNADDNQQLAILEMYAVAYGSDGNVLTDESKAVGAVDYIVVVNPASVVN